MTTEPYCTTARSLPSRRGWHLRVRRLRRLTGASRVPRARYGSQVASRSSFAARAPNRWFPLVLYWCRPPCRVTSKGTPYRDRIA